MLAAIGDTDGERLGVAVGDAVTVAMAGMTPAVGVKTGAVVVAAAGGIGDGELIAHAGKNSDPMRGPIQAQPDSFIGAPFPCGWTV